MAIINTIIRGSGSKINNQDITITENGIYTNDDGYTGLGTVTVEVPTLTKISAYPNGFELDENVDKAILSDGNLTLKINPLECSNSIVSLCENGFCLTNTGTSIQMKRLKNGNVGEEIYNDVLIDRYTDILNGLMKIQYPMNGNTCIVTNGIENKRAKTFVVIGMSEENGFVRCIDYSKQKSNIISSFGDRYCYHSNDGIFYAYDVVQDNDYVITDIDFNNIEMNVVAYRFQNMDYVVNYDSKSKWNIDLNEFNPSCSGNGTIEISKIGLDIIGCQQTKDEKYILCKNGYIKVNDDNTELIECKYPEIVIDAMAGKNVNHFQALYEGYYGFGMEDGRYILCWYDSDTETINETVVWVFEPYIVKDDKTIYHRFFSGYADFWCIPNISVNEQVTSRRDIEIRENHYNVFLNDFDIDKNNKCTSTCILTGENDNNMVYVYALENQKKITVETVNFDETLVIEGVE